MLRVRDLVTVFETAEGSLRAVDGVGFEVGTAETVALVGESGCGKSVTALSLLGLVDPPGRIVEGSIEFRGRELRGLSEREYRSVRGREIAMVFQEPMTSLNPVMTVGRQVVEVFQVHQRLDRGAARRRTAELFALVGIPAPEERLDQYPHQLSGGMRQRVMIAMAIACQPALLVADEPTTALDVTIQAQILDLLDKLRRDLRLSVLVITHDLAVVAETAQRVVVMYAGQVVEQSDVRPLFAEPLHPYTRGLLESLPRPGTGDAPLKAIAGVVPDLRHLPPGCRFAERCPRVFDRCREQPVPLLARPDGRSVRCLLYA
ncbi:MAG: ABC transporter ATP-binding protein [Deltaproteobacteria bacterium]|nr:ABC transporter ATP-binding protein [Deltaproteobacteria bacterium]